MESVKKIYYLKQALLIISIVYFYALAFLLNEHGATYGLDRPLTFIVMTLAFIAALTMEAGLTWWHKRKRIGWWLLLVCSYAVLGFFVAPILYGSKAIVFAMFLPLVAVFVGGFAYAYSTLIYRAFRKTTKLPLTHILSAIKTMPGWEVLADGIEKSFHFLKNEESLRFANACGVVAEKYKAHPHMDLSGTRVKIRLQTQEVNGVTEKDLMLAREFDRAL